MIKLIKGVLLLSILFYYPLSGQDKVTNTDEVQQITSRAIIQNLSELNTPYMEFSPSYYQGGIVFVTSRQRGGFFDPKLKTTYFELFYAPMNKEGIPYKARPFSLEINTKYHEGPVSFSEDANLMFFSRNNLKDGVLVKSKEGDGKMQLYQAQRGIFDWENIKALPFNMDDFNSMHPSINTEGNKLYFSSNRPRGFGGMDIYVVEKIDGKWMSPINLGPDINTPSNEVFPFIHASGTLIFASDGHKGFGGLDLYLIDIGGRKWGQLINMGKTFNSAEDDFGFVMNNNGTQGFFSSSRKSGKGKDDIYLFNAPEGLEGIKVATQIIAKIEVTDVRDGRPLRGSKLRIFEKALDGSTLEGEVYEMEILPSTDGSNEFTLVEKRKETAKLGAPEAEVDQNGFAVITLNPRKSYFLIVDKKGYKSQEIPLNINPAEAYYQLSVPMEPLTCVIVSGNVKDFSKGVPLANTNIKITNTCGEENFSLRTDIEGNFEECLPVECKFRIYAEKAGFQSEVQELTTINLRGAQSFSLNYELKEATALAQSEEEILLEEGAVILLPGIAYDFNKSAIRKGATRDLEALATIMEKHSSLKIEIGAHTDSRGTREYNLALSRTRALYAKDFLVQKGINSRRIQIRGYGESQLRNNCEDGVPCAEQDHGFNRRLEVKITKINERVALAQFNKEINITR